DCEFSRAGGALASRRLTVASRRAAPPRVHSPPMLDATREPTNGAIPTTDYDVVVIGGAFAGASAALLLRRLHPATRVLVVERQERHGKKVGEATVEISGMFMTRVLGLYDYLVREHLPKHGLRYWFQDHAGRGFEELSDAGALKVSSNPSFQLDRSKLDEQVLADAVAAGAELLRPAKVTALDFGFPR